MFARHPEKMADWLRAGCYIQITAASLTGRFGKIAQRVSHGATAPQLGELHCDRRPRPYLAAADAARCLSVGRRQVRSRDRGPAVPAQSARSSFWRGHAASAGAGGSASGVGSETILGVTQQDVWLVGKTTELNFVCREEGAQISRLRSLGVCDFHLPLWFAAGKLPRASAHRHRRGSFGYAQDRLFDSAP